MKTLLVLASIAIGGSVIATNTHSNRSSANHRGENSQPVGKVSIVVDKSDYELHVYDDKGWFATYPVVFGNSSLSDKKNGR